MRILLFGSTGFIGQHVLQALNNHVIYRANRCKTDEDEYCADLTDPKQIVDIIKLLKPDIVINCAGIIENSEKAKLNVEFTKNILFAVVSAKIRPKKIIICGSAAEYGIVGQKHIPVNEDSPLKPTSLYGLSKKEETQCALKFGKKHNLPIIIARLFNPIGVGMNPRFLIPSIIGQIDEIAEHKKKRLEIARLDARRDYINVKDIATGIKAIVELDTLYNVYNLGFGKSTSNLEVVKSVLKNYDNLEYPDIIETSKEPEPLYAIEADITRMKQEFKWGPKYSLDETIKEIMDARKNKKN